jgi:hypothetical protein
MLTMGVAAALIGAAGTAVGAGAALPGSTCTAVTNLNDKCPTWAGALGGTPLALSTPRGNQVEVAGAACAASCAATAATFNGSNGSQLSASTCNLGGNTPVIEAMAFSPDGSVVYGTGRDTPAAATAGETVVATFACSVATGSLLWLQEGPLVAGQESNAVAIAVAQGGGRVYVTGTQFNTGTSALTLAYAAGTGAPLWSNALSRGAGFQDTGMFVAVSPDGGSVVMGESTGAGIGTVAYSTASGSQLWSDVVGSAQGVANDAALAISPDGARVVNLGSGSRGFGTFAYSLATGAPQWSAFLSSGVTATALAISADSARVYVSGTSSTSGQIATAAYSAAGALAWSVTEGLPAVVDSPNALAVSPDGTRLYAAGLRAAVADVRQLTVAWDTATGRNTWVAVQPGLTTPSTTGNGTVVRASRDSSQVFVGGFYGGPLSAVTNDVAAYPAFGTCANLCLTPPLGVAGLAGSSPRAL